MAINWNTPTQPTPTGGSTPSSGGIKWDIDNSSATLAHSQASIDQLRQRETEAKATSDKANSFGTLATQTAGGAVDSLFGGLRKTVKSGIQAVGEAFGSKAPSEQYTSLTGEPQQTYQADLEQGKGSVGGAFGNMAFDAATALPIGKGASLLKEGGGVLLESKALSPIVDMVKKPLAKLSGFLTGRADKKATQDSIDAVYNSPTGKKFTQASGQVATGERQVTPASMFREQGLTPDQQTVNLGTRLKDIKLGSNPVKNTETIANAFQDTETKLQSAFDANPGLSANKPELLSILDTVKTDAPQEFRIRDSQAMINRVVDFAKKTISVAKDDFRNVRAARTSFDQQAKHEFPNAFKPDGSVDTKTPAGYAIQRARDTINEHIYNTAPNGSEMQGLVGREADLYRAARVSMEKAQAGQGKNWLGQWAKEHPTQAKVLETAGVLTLGGTTVGILKSGN